MYIGNYFIVYLFLIITLITIIAIIATTDNNDNNFDNHNNNNNNDHCNNVSCCCHYPWIRCLETSSHMPSKAVSKAMPSEALASLCASKLPEARSPVGRGVGGEGQAPASHHLLTRPAIKGHHSFLQPKTVTLEGGWVGVSSNFQKKDWLVASNEVWRPEFWRFSSWKKGKSSAQT